MATMLKVRVRTLGGVEHVLSSVDPTITIDALKDLLHNETSAPRDGMKLVYKGKELGGSLKDATFTDGDFIVIIVIAANSRLSIDTRSLVCICFLPLAGKPLLLLLLHHRLFHLQKLQFNLHLSFPVCGNSRATLPVRLTILFLLLEMLCQHQFLLLSLLLLQLLYRHTQGFNCIHYCLVTQFKGLGLFGQAAHWDISSSNEAHLEINFLNSNTATATFSGTTNCCRPVTG